MAATPKFKVFSPDGEYIAACKYPEDAGALASLEGAGATIRTGHARRHIVWTEGIDGVAYYSYAVVEKTIRSKISFENAKRKKESEDDELGARPSEGK